MSVQDIYANNKPSGSGDGLWLKLKDGDSYRLRVLGLPVVFDSDFNGNVSTKYAWPVYNHDLGKSQIITGGKQIYNGIAELVEDEEYGDPTEYDIKISRKGSGMEDTTYSVTPARETKALPENVEVPDVVELVGKTPSASNVRRLGDDSGQDSEEEVEIDDIDDKPIDLSEIPF